MLIRTVQRACGLQTAETEATPDERLALGAAGMAATDPGVLRHLLWRRALLPAAALLGAVAFYFLLLPLVDMFFRTLLEPLAVGTQLLDPDTWGQDASGPGAHLVHGGICLLLAVGARLFDQPLFSTDTQGVLGLVDILWALAWFGVMSCTAAVVAGDALVRAWGHSATVGTGAQGEPARDRQHCARQLADLLEATASASEEHA